MHLDKKRLTVCKDDELILEGKRNYQDGLWDTPMHENCISPPTHPSLYSTTFKSKSSSIINKTKIKPKKNKKGLANVALWKKQTKVELAQYQHATCMCPTKTTFIKAIENNHFTTWPGLDSKLISEHLPKSPFAYQRHLKSERQGLQSTKLSSINDITQDYFPLSDIPNKKSNLVYYAIIDPMQLSTGCMDLTGRFPKRSS